MMHPLKSLITCVAIAGVTILASCKKENSLTTTDNAAIASAAAQTQAIAVAPGTTSPGDSIYVVNAFPRNSKLDTIAFASLPSAITDYLNASYPGYILQKTFTIKSVSSDLQGYVVIIQSNSNPVGLKFDATGTFTQILEQREGSDLLGRSWHSGGCFQNRDGDQRDTISLSSLPAVITSYFVSEYTGDTLIRAAKTRDSGYIVLSKNNGLFATVFNASGNFVNRVELGSLKGVATSIDQIALPANALTYLSSTYPGYVFNKAFTITANGVVQGYCVVIEANNTRYGILFDAGGNFTTFKLIR